MKCECARPIRTLIVDDSLELAMKLRELLRTMPEVETLGVALDGAEAVRVSAHLRPELVIMDVQMPEMNGIDAARAIAGVSPESRVLLTSAFGPVSAFETFGLKHMEFMPKGQLAFKLPEFLKKLNEKYNG